MTLALGSSLGAYRIVEQLGRGGMATVYKAYQAALERHVAIKVLAEVFAEEPGFQERFQREAVAVAKLRHPNILDVFDYGEHDGVAYIVNEYVDGGTLAARLGAPLPVESAMKLLAPVASALDYAHAQGVLHRDVKPSNILLTREGTPILADFGLARMIGSLPRLTRTGAALGTPEYMAPEQGAGETVGPAADRYALAVVAYEMLTGRVPFTAETPLAVLLAHMHRPVPPPREINPGLSSAAEVALLKGLAKESHDRYPTATEFVAALGETERDKPVTGSDGAGMPRAAPAVAAPPPSVAPVARQAPPRSKWPRWTAVGVVVAIALAILATIVAIALMIVGPVVALLHGGEKTWQLYRSDDFSNPARGQFHDNSQGTSTRAFSNGGSSDFQWELHYSDSGLVGRISGPYPQNPDRAVLGRALVARDRVPGDFAVEVRARAIRSPGQSRYGFVYYPPAPDGWYYQYRVKPGNHTFDLTWGESNPLRPMLVTGGSDAFKEPAEANLLRMEVRGDTMQMFVNGREVDWIQHENLGMPEGKVGLYYGMDGPPDDDVEVGFNDFKVYTVSP